MRVILYEYTLFCGFYQGNTSYILASIAIGYAQRQAGSIDRKKGMVDFLV